MKIRISFSDEEREDALRLAETVRKLFPRIGKAKESKKAHLHAGQRALTPADDNGISKKYRLCEG